MKGLFKDAPLIEFDREEKRGEKSPAHRGNQTLDLLIWAEVVAQLAERLLTTPVIRGSNLNKFLSVNCTLK